MSWNWLLPVDNHMEIVIGAAASDDADAMKSISVVAPHIYGAVFFRVAVGSRANLP